LTGTESKETPREVTLCVHSVKWVGAISRFLKTLGPEVTHLELKFLERDSRLQRAIPVPLEFINLPFTLTSFT